MSTLTNELESTTTGLLTTMTLFNNKQFNAVPFEGSWTAGQVAQHTLMAVMNLPKMLMGDTAATNRNPEEYVQILRDMFLNFEHKMKSPPAIIPEEKEYDANELSLSLQAALNGILSVANTQDLTLTCKKFEFPTIGELTRVEVINFASVHTMRHTHQMKNIRAYVESAF